MAIDKNSEREVLLSIQNLSVDFKLGRKTFSAVDDVSFDIYKGETFSLVGESGSGKTTVSRAIMRIHQASAGKILYKDEDISANMAASREKIFRQNVQMIFQDPMASLNERAKVDYIISEGLYNYKLFENESDRKEKVEKTLRKVGLLPEFASRFPHEFSGGQRQRIGIARALIMEPEFLVADEPISALDVSIRAQILNLLNKLKREEELTYLFIAHDLSVVKLISDRIAVIFQGKIVELAESEELFSRPLHLYTQCLLSAIPLPDPESEKNKVLKVYDTSIHNYHNERTLWQEAYPGHWVLASERELDFWREL